MYYFYNVYVKFCVKDMVTHTRRTASRLIIIAYLNSIFGIDNILYLVKEKSINIPKAISGGPGFDLRGAWTLSTGGGVIESVEGLSKRHYLACLGHISIKIMLKSNREQTKRRKNCEKLAFWA